LNVQKSKSLLYSVSIEGELTVRIWLFF